MKMDRKLLSSEKHEVAYMAKKLKVSQKLVRLARATAGRSRVKVEAFVKGYLAAMDIMLLPLPPPRAGKSMWERRV